ncbi:MAG: translation initiation factor IF-2 N-terminal domain-containing protein, partial [Terriglobia bacterium]
MGKIRINELARELEVKSNVVIEYLAELGIPDKKSHSSALDDDQADKVRAHFRDGGEAATETDAVEDAAVAPVQPAPVTEAPPVHPGLDLKKIHDFAADTHPLTRSIADIKATARRAVVVPPPAPKPVPPPAAAGPTTPPAAPKPAPIVERPLEKPAPGAPGVINAGAAPLVAGRIQAPAPPQGRPTPLRTWPPNISPTRSGAAAPQAPVARAGGATEGAVPSRRQGMPPPS